MKILKNFKFKYIKLIFIILLVFGYLYLIVSNLVNYKLKSKLDHVPTFKKMNVLKNPKYVRVEDNLTKVEDNLTKVEDNLTKVEDNLTKVEHFSNSRYSHEKKNIDLKIIKNLLKKVQKKLSKKYPFNQTQIMRDRYYSNTIIDKQLLEYAQNIKNTIEMDNNKHKKFKSYIAYNYEDLGDYYSNLDKKGNPIIDNRGKDRIFKSSTESNIKTYDNFLKNKTTNFPSSNKLCPDFKCQRNYMTCTSNHIPKIYKNGFIEDVKQMVIN